MIGRLYRPQRLRYIRRSANHRWALVADPPRAGRLDPLPEPLPVKDDQALIAAYRAGDDAAFAASTSATMRSSSAIARKILGRSSEHAEDVVQEAMLRASRALRRDDRHIELRPWLYRLTRNTALDELARVRTDSVDSRRLRVGRAARPRVDRAGGGGGAARQGPRPARRHGGAACPAAPRAAAARGRRGLARRAGGRARRLAAGDEEPRPPRAHEPRQAARGALARLRRGAPATCSRRTTRAAAPRPRPTATSRPARLPAVPRRAARHPQAPRRSSCRCR